MLKLKFSFFLLIFSLTTIDLPAQVDTSWVKFYNGPANSSDGAVALVVNGSGNVYVTGFSWGGETFDDYVTVKYAPDGETLWVRRYNGTGNGDDRPAALAIDKNMYVYVTGQSFNGISYEYLTIKYTPDGDTIWVRRYNNGVATDLTVDDSGNVYVTGISYGGGTDNDYATIKYAPNGDTLWVRRYNGPGNWNDGAYDLAVDGSGNVYVTGFS